jgi:hypothetical protein
VSGETEHNVSGWTVDTNHSHFENIMTERDKLNAERERHWTDKFIEKDLRDQQRFDAQQKALTDALQSAEKAVTAALTAANTAVGKAETANEKRLDSVNEFRQTLVDQAATFMPRLESEAKVEAITEKIAELAKRVDMNASNLGLVRARGAGATEVWGYVVGAAGVGIAILFHFVR